MTDSTNFSQDDIDVLFKIDYGCAGVVDSNLASRLLIAGHIEQRAALQGTAIYMEMAEEKYIGISHRGRTFLASIRDGVEEHRSNGEKECWREWKP
jgi:hypothetical protein